MKDARRHRGRTVATVLAVALGTLPLVAGDEPASAASGAVATDTASDPAPEPAPLEGRSLGAVELADGRTLRESVILEASATHLRLRHAEGIARVGFGDLPAAVRKVVLDAFTVAAVSRTEAHSEATESLGDWHPFLPDPVFLRPRFPMPAPKSGDAGDDPAHDPGDDPRLELTALEEEIGAIEKRLAELKLEVKHYRARHASARSQGRISSWSAEASRRQQWVTKYEKELRLRKIRAEILAAVLESESPAPETADAGSGSGNGESEGDADRQP